MVKKSAPLLEVERLLDLVPFLSVNPYITLKELAEEFSVSEREMSNELIALSMCGLPGYTPYELIDVSFDSGYVSINNHASLDLPRALTSAEISAFLLGLNIIKDSLENATDGSAQSPRKIEQVDTLIARLLALLDTPIEVDLGTSSHFLSDIERAIIEREMILIRYLTSTDDQSRERQIQPLALRRDGLHIYIYAYCLGSDAFRNFRLDRIESISTVAISSNENLKSKLQRAQDDEAAMLEERPERIRLKVTKNRRRYAELFNIDSIPPSGIVEISIFSQAWLVRTLCAAQGDIELVSDTEIAPMILARNSKILALYRS